MRYSNHAVFFILLPVLGNDNANIVESFSFRRAVTFHHHQSRLSPLFSDWNDQNQDSNVWRSIDDNYEEQTDDWQDIMNAKKDGSFWQTFESSEENDNDNNNDSSDSVTTASSEDVIDADSWLDTLASLQAEEVEFNMKEADRADKVRQMQEWGFEASTIESTLGVAVDTSLENTDEVEGMQIFREESYLEDEDLTLVESHKKVPKDPETGEPIRSQMVYVDEVRLSGFFLC